MKIRIYILFALMAVFGLSSCDKTKGKIEEKVKVFAEALRTNDVATIYDFYPDAKLLSNMKLPNGIQMADMDVVKNDTTGIYTVTIKNPREQKLLIKVLGENKFQIIDSYSLFEINKEFSELAVNTGIPLKSLSDQKLNELLNEDGEYITFIKNKFGGLTKFKLSSFDGVYTSSNSWANINQNIKNDGKFSVKGTDYDVIFTFKDMEGIAAKSTKTIAGVDLEPGETFTYTFMADGYGDCARRHALDWSVTFNQKRGGTLKDVLKKAKFNGTEYDEFVKEASKNKEKENKK